MDDRLIVDLNCDMGESFGRYTLGADAELLNWVTSANIACGLHAGDPLVMQGVVESALKKGVAIGAHPGFPDLQGFGRREMALTPDEVEAYLIYQLGALWGFARAAGVDLTHVKPHGALYNQAARDPSIARAIARGIVRFRQPLILVGLAGSELIRAGLEMGLPVANEGFPDRGYREDGSLKPRREPGAVLESVEAVCKQALALVQQGIKVDGKWIPVDTLCIHGDHPQAVAFARAVRQSLEAEGVRVSPLPAVIHGNHPA